MAYTLEVAESVYKTFKKMKKRESYILDSIKEKIDEILEDPYRFKPLNAPMQHMRRVHIMKSFVLVYTIDKQTKTVKIKDFAHHDEAYH